MIDACRALSFDGAAFSKAKCRVTDTLLRSSSFQSSGGLFAFSRCQSHRTVVQSVQRTAKKCTDAQLLFCSLNLLFGDVLEAVVDEVYLSSLMSYVVILLE